MREIEFCMKYWQCKRCPLDTYCEYFYQQNKGGKNAKDLQDVWGGSRGSHMSIQKEPTKEQRQTERQVQEDKAMDKQKHRDKAEG